MIDLEIPDTYQIQQKVPRKKMIWSVIALCIIILLCAVPTAIYLNFRFYYKNTLKAEDLPDYSTEYVSSIEEGPIQIPIENYHEEGEFKGRKIGITYTQYYDISGIVTSVYDYWGLDDYPTLVPRDVCIAWGSLGELYEKGEAQFSQSGRHCLGKPKWSNIAPSEIFDYKTPLGQTRSSVSSMSNNHLIASSVEIRDKIAGLSAHDRVRIRGYLVSVSFGSMSLNSSATRTDVGNGACEVIYVTSVEKLDIED